jgi:hypothetical protein
MSEQEQPLTEPPVVPEEGDQESAVEEPEGGDDQQGEPETEEE